MGISAGWATLASLHETIYKYLDVSYEAASNLTGLIHMVAKETATDALGLAEAYTDINEQIIYNNIDKDLAQVYDSLDSQIDIVVNSLEQSVNLLQSQIANLSGGITDSAADYLKSAYDSIATAHTAASEAVDKSIESAGEFIGNAYEKVGEFINNGIVAATSWIGDTVVEITSAVNAYVQRALDQLIPAEARAWFATIDSIMTGDTGKTYLDYQAAGFKTQMEALIHLEEDELKKWIIRGSQFAQEAAMESITPTGG